MHRTSAQYIPTALITVMRATRQRQQDRDENGLLDVEADGLLASVEAKGILSPVLLNKQHELIFGERRLTCAHRLGLAEIPVLYIEDIGPDEAECLELIENIKRKELHWKDEVLAVHKFHTLSRSQRADWTLEDTERELGYKQGGNVIRVARSLIAGDARIQRCISMREAWNLLNRADQRAQADIVNDISDAGLQLVAKAEAEELGLEITSLPEELIPPPGVNLDVVGLEASGGVQSPSPSAPSAVPRPPSQVPVPRLLRSADLPAETSILNEDFVEWVKTYSGPKFNFLHCDFPYGKGVFSGPMSGRARWAAQYDDDAGVYWHLIRTLCENLDAVMSPSAHMMFWCAADCEIQARTIEKFRELAPSLVFDTYPLTWHKTDNVGIAPDAKRGPRRVTETCLFASRSDRLIVKLVGNAHGAPTNKEHHPHTKPEPVLRHFFTMFVDSNTRILDPTCGGGSAIRAAESMGAQYVLGLESSIEHHDAAVSALRTFRAKRRASGG